MSLHDTALTVRADLALTALASRTSSGPGYRHVVGSAGAATIDLRTLCPMGAEAWIRRARERGVQAFSLVHAPHHLSDHDGGLLLSLVELRGTPQRQLVVLVADLNGSQITIRARRLVSDDESWFTQG